MKRVIAWLRIIRPPIILISCLGATVGALNAAAYLQTNITGFQIIMIQLGAAFLSAGLMVHNDVTDLKSDEINRPYKPLPQRLIKPETAKVTGITMMVLAVAVAFLISLEKRFLNWECGFLTVAIVMVGVFYNLHGKNHGIFGNIAVAFGVGAIPYWGAISVLPSYPLLMFPLALAIFIQEIGREIMVNAGDYRGDVAAGYRTLPVLVGRKKSMYIALFFYLFFIPVYPLPAADWLNLGVPQVFGGLYLLGGGLFAFSLLLTWFLTYRVVLRNDEKKIWLAFERYERTGTRLMVIVLQMFLILEGFF